ncbi:MAG: AMP-binding protein [Thermoguttaceae bacterium]|nr:AMP-binding protein [Thermoguttaceae bacterium]
MVDLKLVGAVYEEPSFDEMPVRAMIRFWKTECAKKMVIADLQTELKGFKALVAALVLRRKFRSLLAADEKNVGLLIPPCVPSVLANAALTMDSRVTVNLNYTVSPDVLNRCIKKVGIRHLITSRKVLEKFNFEPECDVIFLEDVKASVTAWDKVCALSLAMMPVSTIFRKLGLDCLDPDDTMTILFTSGSTGMPRGVMLSHRNIAGNIKCFADLYGFTVTSGDSMLGALPFFHSFGFTGPLWTVLTRGLSGFYHVSPLEYRPIQRLCRKYKPTMFLGTPTFLRTYARRMEREDLASVKLVITGGERCTKELADEYENRFGIRPTQGYGITETAPVIAANVPESRNLRGWAGPLSKDESVGFPMPGIQVKILDLKTGEPCGVNEVGMAWVKGNNVMKGYYGEPEKTAEVIKDGWYCTGDLVRMDEDNFLFIAGRMSRFAKIGGEMVPHEGLEDLLNEVLGNKAEEEPKICVTSVTDVKKGERLVVLYTELTRSVEEISEMLKEKKVPNLWIPGKDAYFQVDAIPLLGTGKLNLFEIHEIAEKCVKQN